MIKAESKITDSTTIAERFPFASLFRETLCEDFTFTPSIVNRRTADSHTWIIRIPIGNLDIQQYVVKRLDHCVMSMLHHAEGHAKHTPFVEQNWITWKLGRYVANTEKEQSGKKLLETATITIRCIGDDDVQLKIEGRHQYVSQETKLEKHFLPGSQTTIFQQESPSPSSVLQQSPSLFLRLAQFLQ